jgi:hypothetical protein
MGRKRIEFVASFARSAKAAEETIEQASVRAV